MKKRFGLKRMCEGTFYWLGVLVVGVMIGLSIQFVRAWVAPSGSAPNGNVGAPINTSNVDQVKTGFLGVGALLTRYLKIPGSNPVPGQCLKAADATGRLVWGNCSTTAPTPTPAPTPAPAPTVANAKCGTMNNLRVAYEQLGFGTQSTKLCNPGYAGGGDQHSANGVAQYWSWNCARTSSGPIDANCAAFVRCENYGYKTVANNGGSYDVNSPDGKHCEPK